MNNEDIQEKHGKHPLGYHSKLGEYDSGDCQEVMLNEARSDTAKKIFKELDEIKCKGNHKGSATYDNDKYMDVIHVEDYEVLKKKYKVIE